MFNDSFQKTFKPPLFAIRRENNDDGATTTTTTTVFFSFLPSNESTTTKTVRHRTRGSDSRLPVRLLRTGTHTLSLNSLFNSLSRSLSFLSHACESVMCCCCSCCCSRCVYIFIRKKKRAVMFFELRVERERDQHQRKRLSYYE